MACAVLLTALLCVASVQAQTAPVPAAGRMSATDLDRSLQTLNRNAEGVPDIRTVGSRTAAASRAGVPRGYRLRESPLDARAREGLAVSEAWSQTPSLPAPGADGRVLYVYGTGLPTVVCAPLRLCVVELQRGERLVSEPQIGDAVRWAVSAVRSGQGRSAVDLLVLKPKSIGLDTSLLLATDRRAYYLRLLSRTDRYMARVAFDYTEETLDHSLAQLAEPEPEATARVALETLSFAYRVRGRARALTPLHVFDDGSKTYLDLNPALAATELPVLRLLDARGAEEGVNYRVKGTRYIIDRLIERAVLIRGSGRRAERLTIERLGSLAPADSPRRPSGTHDSRTGAGEAATVGSAVAEP